MCNVSYAFVDPREEVSAEWPLKHWQAFRCDVGVVVAGAASAVDPVEDGHGKEGWRLRASMRRAESGRVCLRAVNGGKLEASETDAVAVAQSFACTYVFESETVYSCTYTR